MALLPLLIDWARRLLLNKYTLVGGLILLSFATGYVKGMHNVRERNAIQAVKEATETAIVQEKLEVEHDKRVYKILSHNLVDADISRMLSEWPREASSTR